MCFFFQEVQRGLCSLFGWDQNGDQRIPEQDQQPVSPPADLSPQLPQPAGADGKDPKQLHEPLQRRGKQVPAVFRQCGQQGVCNIFCHSWCVLI